MRLQPIEVGVETIDLEAGFIEHECDEILRRALVTCDGWDPDEVLGKPDASIGVERLHRAYLSQLPDHALSVVASGGQIEGPVAGRVADAAEEDAVFALFRLDRRPAFRTVSKHDEKIGAVDQLELGDLGTKRRSLRGKDARRYEESFHQFAGRDHANEFADVTRLDVSAGKPSLLALDDRPLLAFAQKKVGSTVRTVLAHELRLT